MRITGEKKFDFTLDIFALLISIVALFFSWHANKLSKKQITSEVIILSSVKSSQSARSLGQNKVEIGCTCSLRVANVGGAGTAIVGYITNVTFFGKSSKTESDFSYARINTTPFKNLIYFSNIFLKEELDLYSRKSIALSLGPSNEADRMQKKLPIQIAPFSAIDIVSYFWYGFEGISLNEISSFSERGYLPLEVFYTLKLSNGKRINSPKIFCYYHKQNGL